MASVYNFLNTVNYCQGCFDLQFVCGDGKCLNRNNDDNGVCDGRIDCSDGSDESRCGLGKIVPSAQRLSTFTLCLKLVSHKQASWVASPA